MEFQCVEVESTSPVSGEDCSVRADADMVEVFRRSASSGHSFLFVEDEHGVPVGVISADELLQRMTHPGASELTRWMDRPVEAALQSRIERPPKGDDLNATPLTMVTCDGSLLGFATPGDVLISWRSILKTLKNSQGDAVTGLPNRAAFDQHLLAETNRAQRNGLSVAVLLVDLDYFKQINDQFGHAAGDAALKSVADALRSSLRSYDMVARFGGDEFAVVCTGCREGEIDIVVQRLQGNVRDLRAQASADRPVPTLSIGAAVGHRIPMHSDGQNIVDTADKCLYRAKENGRNCAWKCELASGRPPAFVAVNTPMFSVDNLQTDAFHA